MRKALLLVVVLAVPGLLLAQETQPAQTLPQAKPAPRLGHPLDPADVAILTGKAKASAGTRHGLYAMPYLYFNYPINQPLFSQPLFAPVSTATQPPFAPLLFGRIGERPFVVIGRSAPVRPDLLFSLGGWRRSPTLVRAPVSPGFRLWRR